MNCKVLIVDDDLEICDLLRNYLEKEEYEAVTVTDGADAINTFKIIEPDIVLLDITLPHKDGFQICREIRGFSSKPVIMVSAKTEIFDKVLSLELGADDYVTKPFDCRELVARMKAILRRCGANPMSVGDETIKLDKMEISLQKYNLKLADKSVSIPPKELELLYFLVSNCNRVFTRNQLLDKVWGFDYLGDSRTVDVHIKRIREKIEGVSEKWELKTVWGVGYKFELTE